MAVSYTPITAYDTTPAINPQITKGAYGTVNEAVDAFVDAVDPRLREHDGEGGVACAICDPELLRFSRGAVDSKLLLFLVVIGGGLHLGSIVSVSELREAEAAHLCKRVALFHE